MTFYEAALEILQREGKPLHAKDITEQAIKENLLSHVGMQPEVTMASRLAAMARRSQDRRLVAVEPDTFGLVDWSVEASPTALEQSGVVETHDESEPQLRSRERHPRVDKDNVRVAGRSDRRRKYEELERKKKKKKKRLPPLPELVYDILDRTARAVPVFDLAAAIREHDLVSEDIGREALEKALRAENERREGEDRKPVFSFTDEGLVGLAGREEPEEEADLLELVTKVVARLAEERKPAAAPEIATVAMGSLDQFVAAERERAVGMLRQRLAELEAPALEAVSQAMLENLGYRDVRVAKRHKDGSLFTSKRRMGLTEVRFAVRVIRGSREVRREDVLELRRDMLSHSAQMGVVLSPSDVTREGRSEAAQSGAALVTLLCADALAEQLAERGLGVRQRQVQVSEFDPAAFRALAGGAVQARQAPAASAPEAKRESSAERRERRERERREWREKRARERDERRKAREAAQAAGGEAPAEEEGHAERAVGGEAHEGVAAEAVAAHEAREPGLTAGAPEVAAAAADAESIVEPAAVEAPAAEEAVAPAETTAPAMPAPAEAPPAAEATAEAEPAPIEAPSAPEVVAVPAEAAAAPVAVAAPAEAAAPETAAAEAAPAAAPEAAAPEEAAAPAEAGAASEDAEAAADKPRRRRRRTRAAAPEATEGEAETEPAEAAPKATSDDEPDGAA